MRIRIGDVANPASIDHADLGALESDDHLQYHTDARAETWLETLLGAAPATWGATLFAPLYAAPLKTATVTVSSAELLALNASPKTLIAAPAAGKALILVAAELWLDFATTKYDGIAAGEDLTIRYTDGSGALLATIETDPFLAAEADAFRYVEPTTTAAITPVAEAPLVLHLSTGEIATGDSPLKLRLLYRELTLTW
mgnify:CR=1 FL=1